MEASEKKVARISGSHHWKTLFEWGLGIDSGICVLFDRSISIMSSFSTLNESRELSD